MDVSGSILANLDAGLMSEPFKVPCSTFNVRSPNPELGTRNPEQRSDHAGMTKSAFSFSVGERKIMEHFVVNRETLTDKCLNLRGIH